ncbi:hypothetical protein BDB00DRAFT_801534 [Zychaea mexicana]|uniref:uncharacterized protein n=1 Tax=Zychaea mexicana TaxID=64656 RepID=UPI0022FE7403|nr:uncharacterized protein BDB00DRAFT_801534 [Zychaea mexicana]KAI9498190.1 hypothetical protein BDB00DRAFT_801534 [Zychaea mexicana]
MTASTLASNGIASTTNKSTTNNKDNAATTMRPHGGRHRIFTEEQRKVRNRQAQAAFRERRSQYTQTLEQTIVGLENIIEELQESNRNTSVRADVAEQRCTDLEKHNQLLHQLIVTVTAENQRLHHQQQQQKQQQQFSPFITVPEPFESESGSVEEELNRTPPAITVDPHTMNKTLIGECLFQAFFSLLHYVKKRTMILGGYPSFIF